MIVNTSNMGLLDTGNDKKKYLTEYLIGEIWKELDDIHNEHTWRSRVIKRGLELGLTATHVDAIITTWACVPFEADFKTICVKLLKIHGKPE